MTKIDEKYLKSLGMAIKENRIIFKTTLDRLSEGICCISYLSKLENGKLNPERGILNALLDRLSLDLNEIIELYEICDLVKSLKAFFELDSLFFANIYEKIEGKAFSIKSGLIKSMYYLINEDYKALDKNIKKLDIFSGMFDDLEVAIFNYLKAECNIKTHKLMVAKKITDNIDYISAKNNTIQYLLHEQLFQLNYLLGKNSYVIENYENLKKVTFEWVPIKRRVFNELILLEFKTELSKKMKGFENDKTFELVLNNFDMNCWYFYLKSLINLGKYEDVVKKIEDNKLESPAILAMLTLTYFYLKDVERTKLLEERMKDYVFEKKDLVHKNFIYYIFLKTNNRIDEANKALKTELINFAFFTSNKFYNKIYSEDYIVYLLENSRYKEAASFFRKFM